MSDINRIAAASEALKLPSEAAPCAGEACTQEVSYHSPPLREGEKVYCVPCGTKLVGADKVPPGAEYLRIGQHPVERIVSILSDRFERRFGRKPSVKACSDYKEATLAFALRDPKTWTRDAYAYVADGYARYRDGHPTAWNLRYLLQPRSDLEGLREIAAALNNLVTREHYDQSQQHRPELS